MSNPSENKAAAASKPVLLSYQFSTSPSPLEVSTTQIANSGRINVSVAPAGSAAVYCNQIIVAVPVGELASDLTDATPNNSVNTADWAPQSVQIMTGDDLGLVGDQTSYAAFTYKSRDASVNDINYNLVFGLVAEVNQKTGTFNYLVQENSGTTSDASTFEKRTDTFTLSKDLPRFYLNNLVATTVAAPTVPCTEFANGADFRLSWESSGTFFQLFSKGNPTPIYSGTDTSFPVAGGVSTDSTFVLMATVTGDPTNDGGTGYEPVYLFDALTVTISNPALTPSSVAVSGNETIAGTLGVTGDTHLTETYINNLAVAGNETIGGTLAVTGSETIGGTLAVAAATTLSTLTVNGNELVSGGLNVAGSVSAGRLSTGNLNASGGGTLNGYMNLCAAPDHSKGNVGIGGANFGNVSLTVTNSQTGKEMAVYIDGRNLSPSSPGWALYAQGPCINTTGSWYKVSDRALKDEIQSYDDGLAQIMQINPVRYRYKKDIGLNSEFDNIGVIAQDIEEIAPYMVGKSMITPDSEETFLSVDSGPLSYMLINAVKELKAEVDALKKKLEN